MTRVPSRTLTRAGMLGLVATTAIALLVTQSTAAYVDQSNARTATIAASVEPPFMTGFATNSRMVDTGLGLSNDGNVYVWGLTSLGINGGAANPGGQRAPQAVPFPAGTNIRQIGGQIYDVNALDSGGYVWGWGNSNDHNGTDATRTGNAPQRLRIGTAWNGSGALLDNIVSLTTTEQAGMGIRADGTVWRWGQSFYGGGQTDGASQLTGLPNPAIAGNRPVVIKGAYTTFTIILENGAVYSTGGSTSSLPPGSTTSATTATQLSSLSPWFRSAVTGNAYIVAVDGGINMGAALLANGQVLSWGGVATRTGRGAPTSPAIIPTLSNITSMNFGYTGVVMLDSSNTLRGYGASDDYGQLPLLPVPLDTNVRQYASGQGYYIWQRADGTFWGRGYNPQGAIGLPVGTQSANRQISWNLGVVAK